MYLFCTNKPTSHLEVIYFLAAEKTGFWFQTVRTPCLCSEKLLHGKLYLNEMRTNSCSRSPAP